jgi:lipoprotein-anchoring transpeptidase ErfK/SrfK
VKGTGDDEEEGTLERSFTTQELTLAQQTYPSVAPLKGETVGVGMPVIVTFDLPVKRKKLFERNMSITTDQDVEGSWSWISDSVVHYRPKEYWPANTKVDVDLNLNSLPAGNGVYGQQNQNFSFKVGRKVVSTVNITGHTLSVNIDGKRARTIPVSTGDSRHRTRQGTKIIMEKFPEVDMDAATTGVDSEDPDYYDIEDVKWAMRVTNSGEFLHAAPWSSASHGRSNVSHGCTGMSTANAAWLYERSKRGDVVEFTNSPRGIEDQNGWTDWNVPWDDWKAGSALS